MTLSLLPHLNNPYLQDHFFVQVFGSTAVETRVSTAPTQVILILAAYVTLAALLPCMLTYYIGSKFQPKHKWVLWGGRLSIFYLFLVAELYLFSILQLFLRGRI